MSIYDDYVKWAKAGGSAYTSPVARAAQQGQVLGTGGGGSSSSGERGQSPLEWGIDMISRPLYAVTGGLTQAIRNAGKSSAGDAIGSVLEGAWKGLTSTDQADKYHGVDVIDEIGKRVASENGDTYEAPTLSSEVGSTNEEAWKNIAAVGRGIGGFAIDVGADPLTYGTLGIGTAVKTGGKAIAKQVAKKMAEGAAETGAESTVRAAGRGAADDVLGGAVTARQSAASSSPTTAPSRQGALNVSSPAPSSL